MRIVLRIIAGILVIALMFSLFAALYVRGTIADGALNTDARDCMNPRDKEKLDAGPDQYLADWWLIQRVYRHRRFGNGMSGSHLSRFIAQIGLSLTYSPEERIEIAYRHMKILRTCNIHPQKTEGIIVMKYLYVN